MYTIAMFWFKGYFFLLFKRDKIAIRQFLKVLGYGNRLRNGIYKAFSTMLETVKKALKNKQLQCFYFKEYVFLLIF